MADAGGFMADAGGFMADAGGFMADDVVEEVERRFAEDLTGGLLAGRFVEAEFVEDGRDTFAEAGFVDGRDTFAEAGFGVDGVRGFLAGGAGGAGDIVAGGLAVGGGVSSVTGVLVRACDLSLGAICDV